MTKSLEIYRSTRTTVIKAGRVSSHRGSLPFLRYLHKFHPNIYLLSTRKPSKVKNSTKNYTITSLQKFIKKFNRQLATPIVVHYQDYQEKDGITYLPIYMVPLL